MLYSKDGRKGQYVNIALPPGTHHLMFLVDDVMMTNPDLPTAVDYNNVLVNYIEIAIEDVVKPRRESNQTVTDKREVVYPAQQTQQPAPVPEEEDGVEEPMDEAELLAEEIKPGDFRRIMPQALEDIDCPDEDQRYIDAARVIGDCQGPPSLPLFLGKAILNGTLPNKDDSSVLGLPNHTVLNHLMTSSVKNGVLATSTTTRYRSKVSNILHLSSHLLIDSVCHHHQLQACPWRSKAGQGQGLEVELSCRRYQQGYDHDLRIQPDGRGARAVMS